jgi:hypothetical protein
MIETTTAKAMVPAPPWSRRPSPLGASTNANGTRNAGNV